MDYSTDRPIDTGEQDLLGRLSFSEQLGKAIYEYDGKDGLVIGLFGKWGIGKTSIINMATNEIDKLAKNDKNKPLVMRFLPWNYSDKDNLISLFFQSLKNKIDIQDDKQLKNKVGKALSDYAGAFDALSLVPVVGSSVAVILKTLAQVQGTNLMKTEDLDETREKLEQELVQANKKIIIVIDDIDRLTNSQIRDIFQMVKQVADFPNVIYVLVMDRDVVRSALTEVQNVDGNEYLEKIVQVSFEIPELRKSKLHNILFAKLDKIVHNLSNNIVCDKNYLSIVFENCISPYINTLRDINRLINTFQFRYGFLHQETSFEDMLAITTLEVLEPELYKWIRNNKYAVCGGLMYGLLSKRDNKQGYRKLYHDEFTNIGIDPDIAIRCISTIFPVFAKDVNEYHYDYQSTLDLKGKMRVADEGRFESYFMFDLEDIKVPRNLINTCIFECDMEELSEVIEKINQKGDVVYFLEEIKALVDEIPYKRLDLIASVLLALQGDFEYRRQRYIGLIPARKIASSLIYGIIKRLDTKEEKYKIFRFAIEKVSKNGLGTIAGIIHRIELAYGRLEGNSENEDEQIISLVQLEALENMYVKRIRDIVNSELIWDIDDFKMVFHLWRCFDKNEVVNYLERSFKCEVNKLKFVCAMADRWHSADVSGWGFSSEKYTEYISQKEAYNIIQNFNKSKLDKFTEIEQIQLASFALYYDNNEMEYVNEEEAKKLVNEWKTKK